MDEWEQIINDSDFDAQPDSVRAQVATNYFKKNFVSDPSFKSQSDEIKSLVKRNFYTTLQRPAEKVPMLSMSAYKDPALDALSRIQGIPEALMSLGSGALSALARPATEYTKQAQGLDPRTAHLEAEEAAQETTYKPYTKYGQEYANIAGTILGFPFLAADKLIGEPAQQMVETSVVGETIEALGGKASMVGQPLRDIITFGVGSKGLGKGLKGLKGAITKADSWYRTLTIPERGLVVQSLQDMIIKGINVHCRLQLHNAAGNRYCFRFDY